MARWRSAAMERLPELRESIASAENVMQLWIELNMKFEDAYREPRDDGLIARVYSYADWCIAAPRNESAEHDPLTAVTVTFYEHIPTVVNAREDMPRWFTFNEVSANREVFSYLIGADEYAKLLKYMSENRRRYVPREQIADANRVSREVR